MAYQPVNKAIQWIDWWQYQTLAMFGAMFGRTDLIFLLHKITLNFMPEFRFSIDSNRSTYSWVSSSISRSK